MTMIAPRASIASRPHQVTLSNPGAPVPDGEGGSTQTPVTLATVMASIVPATARDLERITSGTVLAQASQVVTIPYVPGVTSRTSVQFKGRVLSVLGITNPEERNIELILVCTEVVA